MGRRHGQQFTATDRPGNATGCNAKVFHGCGDYRHRNTPAWILRREIQGFVIWHNARDRAQFKLVRKFIRKGGPWHSKGYSVHMDRNPWGDVATVKKSKRIVKRIQVRRRDSRQRFDEWGWHVKEAIEADNKRLT